MGLCGLETARGVPKTIHRQAVVIAPYIQRMEYRPLSPCKLRSFDGLHEHSYGYHGTEGLEEVFTGLLGPLGVNINPTGIRYTMTYACHAKEFQFRPLTSKLRGFQRCVHV
jgi:hypothetical protein